MSRHPFGKQPVAHVPRKLKKALKKQVNLTTGNAWKLNEIHLHTVGKAQHIAPGKRKKFIQAQGAAVLSHSLIPR